MIESSPSPSETLHPPLFAAQSLNVVLKEKEQRERERKRERERERDREKGREREREREIYM